MVWRPLTHAFALFGELAVAGRAAAAAPGGSLLHGGVVVTTTDPAHALEALVVRAPGAPGAQGQGQGGGASLRVLVAAQPGSTATAVNVTVHNLGALLQQQKKQQEQKQQQEGRAGAAAAERGPAASDVAPDDAAAMVAATAAAGVTTWQFNADAVDDTADGAPHRVAGGVVQATADGGGSVQVSFPLAPPAVVLLRLDQV